MVEDLYKTLGIKRDAQPATIKSAYRKMSKRHHPDAGGDPKAFAAIVRAKTILLDAAKRAKYDSTGELDDAPDNAQAQVLQAVMGIVQRVAGALAQMSRDPETEDLVKLSRAQLRADIETVTSQIVKIPENVDKARALAKRFSNTAGEPNQIGAMFESQARSLEDQVAMMRRQIAIFEQAEAFLGNYAFETKERARQPQYMTFSFDQTGAFKP